MNTDPRWLDARELEAVAALGAVVAWLPVALEAQLERDSDVSLHDFQVLTWLSMRPGRQGRMSDLASLANVKASHMSRIAARLESHGWIVREPDPDDGRGTLARLTEEGGRKVRATAPGHVAEIRRILLDPLTDAQVDQLRAIADAIGDVVRPAGCGPRPPLPADGTLPPGPLTGFPPAP